MQNVSGPVTLVVLCPGSLCVSSVMHHSIRFMHGMHEPVLPLGPRLKLRDACYMLQRSVFAQVYSRPRRVQNNHSLWQLMGVLLTGCSDTLSTAAFGHGGRG
jgi:hypothetical protein